MPNHQKITTDVLVEIILSTPEELVFWDDQLLDDVAVVLQARCDERDDPSLTRPQAVMNLLNSAALASMRRDGARRPDLGNARAWLAMVLPSAPSEEQVVQACIRYATMTKRPTRRNI